MRLQDVQLLLLLCKRQQRNVPPERAGATTPASTTIQVEEFEVATGGGFWVAAGALALTRYALYVQDFGGPVGFRLATRRPEQIRALIVQNANAYEEGVSTGVRDVVLRIWKDRTPQTEARLRELFELPATKRQYLEGASDPSLVSPDAWEHAQWGMDRPGDKEIQFTLHANYGSNVEHYAEWHTYFRKYQPPTLIVWGERDFIFLPAGAEAYRRDLKRVELHMLDAGHFALETNAAEIAGYIREFSAAQK